jgi:lipoprotein signal peptidase
VSFVEGETIDDFFYGSVSGEVLGVFSFEPKSKFATQNLADIFFSNTMCCCCMVTGLKMMGCLFVG